MSMNVADIFNVLVNLHQTSRTEAVQKQHINDYKESQRQTLEELAKLRNCFFRF